MDPGETSTNTTSSTSCVVQLYRINAQWGTEPVTYTIDSTEADATTVGQFIETTLKLDPSTHALFQRGAVVSKFPAIREHDVMQHYLRGTMYMIERFSEDEHDTSFRIVKPSTGKQVKKEGIEFFKLGQGIPLTPRIIASAMRNVRAVLHVRNGGTYDTVPQFIAPSQWEAYVADMSTSTTNLEFTHVPPENRQRQGQRSLRVVPFLETDLQQFKRFVKVHVEPVLETMDVMILYDGSLCTNANKTKPYRAVEEDLKPYVQCIPIQHMALDVLHNVHQPTFTVMDDTIPDHATVIRHLFASCSPALDNDKPLSSYLSETRNFFLV